MSAGSVYNQILRARANALRLHRSNVADAAATAARQLFRELGRSPTTRCVSKVVDREVVEHTVKYIHEHAPELRISVGGNKVYVCLPPE